MEDDHRKLKTTAIVLAGGSGHRMKSSVKKQFMPLGGKPLLFYPLEAFQKSDYIDRIVLVTGADETEYCRREIKERFLFDKISEITAGGAERYDSVYRGLTACGSDTDIVFIHDGARPFVTGEMIRKSYDAAAEYQAGTVGMPVKDTIRIADSRGFSLQTPDRSSVWQIQTPQTFRYSLALEAYRKLEESGCCGNDGSRLHITDDAMVVEYYAGVRAKLVEGSYENIKITTPEDLIFGEGILHERQACNEQQTGEETRAGR